MRLARSPQRSLLSGNAQQAHPQKNAARQRMLTGARDPFSVAGKCLESLPDTRPKPFQRTSEPLCVGVGLIAVEESFRGLTPKAVPLIYINRSRDDYDAL